MAGMWEASQSSARNRESQGAPPPPTPTLGTEAMSHLLFKLPGQEFKADKKCLPSYLCYSFTLKEGASLSERLLFSDAVLSLLESRTDLTFPALLPEYHGGKS